MTDTPPWKPIVLNEKYEGPEGNVWTGCRECGGKWRSDDGWIYREKIIPVTKEVAAMLAMLGSRHSMAKWEYICPSCLPDDYKPTKETE